MASESSSSVVDVDGSASLDAARERFRQFFAELRARFIEREDAIEQIALALLAREHVLLTGPPGTAKSALCRAVLQNIVDRDSGEPSVFARQFTESTVQTDLIGPVDFKTLMDTGRSEHFTDEGMLGAVHAFLDEVLDGRDMLLRATLNVLQERELKQGTKTTRGAIECALMTTNRYLSEVLEQSRETLLAFVDRIAFIAFVPKSFADPQNLVTVVSGQLGPRARVPMPRLTIQDLDQLQELASFVRFPESVAQELVGLLERLEAELAAATRADPRFLPTRYLSTRTAVRTAHVLRAAVVLDWALADPSRPLAVRASDFERLRLTLLLGGPALAQLPGLLEREPDARERRQLSIYQTERHAFDRVLAQVKDLGPAAESARNKLPSLAELRAQGLDQQLATCERLARLAEQGGRLGLEARGRLRAAGEVLAHRVLSHALRAGIAAPGREHAVGHLERMANLLDAAHPQARELVPMLRTRALELLEAELDTSLTTKSGVLEDVIRGKWKLEDSLRHTKERLSELEDKRRLRDALIEGGAVEPAGSSGLWERAIDRLLDEVVQLWELGFDVHLKTALEKVESNRLDALLASIQKPLAEMNACGRWFVPFGKESSCVAARVVDTKLMPFVEQALAQQRYDSRRDVSEAIEKLLQRLDEAEAQWAVSSEALVEWATRALLEAEPPAKKRRRKLSYEGYREFRKREPESALCYSLVDVCTHIALAAPELRARHSPSVALVREQLATLPEALVARIVEEDEARVEHTLEFFEEWWGALTGRDRAPEEQLGALKDSRFHELLEKESALVRFRLEAQLLAELFPSAKDSCAALAARLQAFGQKVQEHLHGLMHARSLAGWGELSAAPAAKR